MIAVDAHTHRAPPDDVLAVVNLPKDSVDVPEAGFFSAGIHPWFIRHERWKEDLLWLEQRLGFTNVLAVGECGLDRLAKTPWKLQQEVFEQQLMLAETYAKPVIIHNVRAGSELLQIRKQMNPVQRWLLHGYHGALREAELMLMHGCFFGFGKHLFQPKSRAAASCRFLPIGNILPETDDADILVQDVIKAIANIKELNEDMITAQLYSNFLNFFQLDASNC